MKTKQIVLNTTTMIALCLSVIFYYGCQKDADLTTEAPTTNTESSLATDAVSATAARNASALLLESTFDNSTTYLNGWSNMQHCCDYSITNSTTVSRAGGKSVKFDLYNTDAIVSSSKRAEITRDIEAETCERWYGGSFYLDQYDKDAGMESIIQWHDVDGTTPPLSLQIGSGKLMLVQSFASGLTSTDLGDATTKKWTDIVIHVKWTAANTGVLELWKDGTKVLSKTNIRTNSKGGNYLKLGINKWSWAPGGGTSTAKHRVMYWDEFRIGKETATYNDVAPGGTASSGGGSTGGGTGTGGGAPVTNTPPTVNAGTAQTITLPISTVTLSGSASDPGGSVASYAWTKVSGNGGTITNAAAAQTTVTGLTAGVYVFNLKATDNLGASSNSTVTITVNAAPASGVRSNLIVESTFEGSNYLANWSNLQHCCDYSITNSTAVARTGSKSVKFDLRRTDPIVSSSVRSEITQDIDPESCERWYGLSYYLSNYASDNGGESLIQWHDIDGSSPPLSLQVWGTDMSIVQSMNGGLTQTSIGSVVSNQWIDIVIHVKWSASNNGLIEVWRNGTKVMSKSGIRTNSKGGNYLKVGINKWSWAPGGGTSSVNQRVFYIDDLRIGNEKATYNDVKPGN